MVDEIYDKFAASKMGIEHKGQVCIMIHSGSRGFGHQVATGNVFKPLISIFFKEFFRFSKIHLNYLNLFSFKKKKI